MVTVSATNERFQELSLARAACLRLIRRGPSTSSSSAVGARGGGKRTPLRSDMGRTSTPLGGSQASGEGYRSRLGSRDDRYCRRERLRQESLWHRSEVLQPVSGGSRAPERTVDWCFQYHRSRHVPVGVRRPRFVYRLGALFFLRRQAGFLRGLFAALGGRIGDRLEYTPLRL